MNAALFIHSRLRVDDFHPFWDLPLRTDAAMTGSHSIFVPICGADSGIDRPDWADLFEVIEVGAGRATKPFHVGDDDDWFGREPPPSNVFAAAFNVDAPSRPPFGKKLLHVVFVPPIDDPLNKKIYEAAEPDASRRMRYASPAIERATADLLRSVNRVQSASVWAAPNTLTIAISTRAESVEDLSRRLRGVLMRECVQDFVILDMVRVEIADAGGLSQLGGWIEKVRV